MEMLKDKLKNLKDYGCSGVKISFEDEGALLNEIITMRYLTSSEKVDMSIKIGGCEAKRDMVDCTNIQCDSIVAPMIESAFSLKKFITAIKQYKYDGHIGFNLETITGYKNIDEFTPLSILNDLHFITIGRVDFIGSLNKDRSFVDSDEMYEIVETIFKKVKSSNSNIKCYLGGAISIKSKEFIKKLFEKNLIDKFETRYIIFDAHKIDFDKFDHLLFLANVFEVEWLKFIHNRYNTLANKDIERIKMIEERIRINTK